MSFSGPAHASDGLAPAERTEAQDGTSKENLAATYFHKAKKPMKAPVVMQETPQSLTTTPSVTEPKSETRPEESEVAPSGPMTPQIEERPEDQSLALGAGDEVRVLVYGEPDLSKTYKIGGDGTIAMPLIGNILVAGLEPRNAEKAIAEKLKNGYLVDPSVAIEIAQRRPFYILGEVRAPGSYSYVSNMTVLNAVALAGGFTYRADEEKIRLLQSEQDQSNYKKISTEYKILPGDIILVKERFF